VYACHFFLIVFVYCVVGFTHRPK